MTDFTNITTDKQNLIKQLEARTNNKTSQINTKTPDIPNDSVELSTKKEEKKSLYTKIAIAAAAAAAIIGTAIYLKKHPDKVDEIAKEGKQKIEEAEAKAKQKAEEEARRAAEQTSGTNVKEKLKVEKPKVEKPREPEKTYEELRAEAKKAELEKLYKRDMEQANEFLTTFFQKADDEVADLLQAKYKDELLGPTYNIQKAYIYDKNIAAEVLLEKAASVNDPVEKERLLAKAVDFVSEKVNPCNEFAHLEKLEDISTKIDEVYKTQGIEFKLKDTIQKTISEKMNKSFHKMEESKILNEVLGSDADYALFKTLREKSRNFKNCFGDKENPMAMLKYTNHKRDKSLNIFLHTVLPDVIREEKSVVKKEDLWMKFLNVTRRYENDTRHTDAGFDILNRMNETFYKGEIKLPKGETLKYKEEVQSQLKETIDEFIFKKFDIPSIKTDEEKLALAKEVIIHSNGYFYYSPKDVKTEHIAKGLMNLGKKTNNEKYLESAIDIAMSKNEKKYACEMVDKVLSENQNLSSELKQKLTKIRDDFRSESKKAAEEIAKSIKAKPLKEAFETFTSRQETKDAIKELAQKRSVAESEIIAKMQQGDGQTIRSVIKESIYNSKAEMFLSDLKDTPIWEDVVVYLDKVDDIVKDKKELEYLQNIRLRALGALVRTTKSAAPEKSEGYRELLRSHVTNMLYTKGAEGKLAQEKIDEEAVNLITNYMEQLVFVPVPENIMFNAIERLLERPYYKQETVNTLKTKMQEIKDRLEIKTDEDFYNEFYNRFNGKAGGAGGRKAASNVTKAGAIETLNKYIEGEKLTDKSPKAEIKSAYRKLALKYHPDSCGEADKAAYEEIFKAIGEAYGSLR